MPSARARPTNSAFRSAHLPPRLPVSSMARMSLAHPAAPHPGVTEGVLHDPLVDGARLFHVTVDTLGDLLGRLLHDPVGTDQITRLPVPAQHGAVLRGRIHARLGHVHEPIAGRVPGSDLRD